MKKIDIFRGMIMLFFTTVNYGQAVQDCGCSAALRYDVYKSKNDFYSEMLLARDISMENYKDIQQQAGADLSIFGIGIGANGENIQKIKEVYNERLFNRNVLTSMTEYESITTSNISYATYKACMDKCIRSAQSGIDAYILSENANEIFVDLHYAAAQNSPLLRITYNDGVSDHTTKLQPNTWASPAIKIPRRTREAFSVVFSAGGQYQSVVVPIKAYRPITANLTVSYTQSRDVEGPPIAYAAVTTDNSRGEKGNFGEIIHGPEHDASAVQYIANMGDGGVAISDNIFSREGYWATRVGFKATARDGYKLRNPMVSCSGSACGGWCENENPFISNTENLVIYTEKRYSSACTLSFSVQTHKLVSEEKVMGVISTSNTVSIVMPPGSSNGVIRYTGGALPLGDSNGFLRLIVHTSGSDGFETYDYEVISPPVSQRTAYRLQLQ